MKPKFFIESLVLMVVGLSFAYAQPICTPNLTPKQAFLAIKNSNNSQGNPTNLVMLPTPSKQPQISTQMPFQLTSNLININTASEAELAQLNGISSKKAQDIILYREIIAPFRTIDDLDNVKGIGKATVDKNRNIITVGDGKTVAK